MTEFNYDQIFEKVVDEEVVEYGMVHGNERIVFIKTGANGNIRGYQDKYLKMAHRIHERLGATVICTSNPWVDYEVQVEADKAMIEKVAAAGNFSEYEVYLSGTSDGAFYNLLLAKELPQTVKILSINPSLNSVQDFVEKVQALPHVQKIMVYGTRDDVYNECVPVLQALECKNLEILTVEGADHEFTGMVDKFIALIDLI